VAGRATLVDGGGQVPGGGEDEGREKDGGDDQEQHEEAPFCEWDGQSL
jgi:hypothetical protein